MRQHTVLCDLASAHKSRGLSGIPSDMRHLFHSLAHSQNLVLSGLISRRDSEYKAESLRTMQGQAIFFGHYLHGKNYKAGLESFWEKVLIKLISRHRKEFIERAMDAVFPKMRADLYPFLNDMDFVQIWRGFFDGILPSNSMEVLANKKYYLTPLGNRYPQKRIMNTEDFDFVIFQELDLTTVSKNSIKLVRYHDGSRLFSPEFFPASLDIIRHVDNIKTNEESTIFVCNSTSSLNDLTKISEKAAEKAVVIPCALTRLHRIEVTKDRLLNVARRRVSTSTSTPGYEQENVTKWFNGHVDDKKIPQFLMTLSTIEPRKNHTFLINAWQKLRIETGEDIKLMIVGSKGWQYEEILQEMRPYIEAGDLLHLEKVPQAEMSTLYSAASCFVSPSFFEGFGRPPIEAMQCGCPVAVSDILAHRYAAGNAALFFNPYDLDDCVHAMKQLLPSENNFSMREDLIQKGYVNFKPYMQDAIQAKWEELFDTLAAGRK